MNVESLLERFLDPARDLIEEPVTDLLAKVANTIEQTVNDVAASFNEPVLSALELVEDVVLNAADLVGDLPEPFTDLVPETFSEPLNSVERPSDTVLEPIERVDNAVNNRLAKRIPNSLETVP